MFHLSILRFRGMRVMASPGNTPRPPATPLKRGEGEVSAVMWQRTWMRGSVPPLERGLGGVFDASPKNTPRSPATPLKRGEGTESGDGGNMTRRSIIPYDPRLKERARELRSRPTWAEVALWKHLRGKQVGGCDFHRQKPLDAFIVDFFCAELMLAVEIDGSSHGDRQVEDTARQRRLESLGVRFLRFSEREVLGNVTGVVTVIRGWIEEHTPASGRPSQEG